MRLEHENTLVGEQTENFVIYKFLCYLSRDFGAPSNVIFTDTKLKTEHFVSVRSVETRNVKEKQTLVMCLDMNSYNRSFIDPFTNVTNLLQYFLHYEIIGATEFIVYNPNIFTRELKSMAAKYGIRMNVLPYNFPFELNEKAKNRLIIQTDCLLRNVHLSNFVAITGLNEYLYPDSRLRPGNNFLKSLKTVSSEVNRFEITKRSVCLDFRKRILVDNYLYNIDMRNEKFYLYRPYQQNDYKNDIFKTHATDQNQISVHQYVKCINRTDLYDWRTILPEGYLNFVYDTGKELNTLMYK
jgi:Glycosyltransferase family 92